jgi:hypothetical protein
MENIDELEAKWSKLPPPGKIDPDGVQLDQNYTVPTIFL